MGLPIRQASVRLMNFEPIFVDSQSLDFSVKGSFKIATICDSVNLDFLMTYAPYRESLLFTCIRSGAAYDHDTATPLPRDQSSQAGGHGETDEDIVTRNSRRGSKFVRKDAPVRPPLFGPTPRV